MKAGKFASLILILILAAMATILMAASLWQPRVHAWLHERPPLVQLVIIFGAFGLFCMLILFPAGMAFDRSMARLRDLIDSTGVEESKVAVYSGPRWLSPVTRAITGTVDRFVQRERGLRGQLRDLEIRHRVSEAQRRQIEAVLNSLRDGVVVTDAFAEIVMANAAAARALSFELKDAIHKPIDQVILDGRLCQLVSDARETANFTDRRHIEHEVNTKAPGAPAGPGGETRRVYEVALSCVENHKHEVGGVVMILHDMTREREVSQMKSDFVSKASHELRTPLSSIRAYVEMLTDGEATDEASRREFYQVIHNETERLGRLIDNMLNISRIEAGIVQIEREDVDLMAIIDRAVEALELQGREKKITLHAKSRGGPGSLTVEGDADMLYQVVLNLVSNAVKYTPEGGRVSISADSDNLTRSVVVTVADTGLGIPPAAMPKLFDKFFRVENYQRVAKGTGLGLSLCKHIVETVHHGQIGVESQLGMGSKFWFSVPMRYAGSVATQAAA